MAFRKQNTLPEMLTPANTGSAVEVYRPTMVQRTASQAVQRFRERQRPGKVAGFDTEGYAMPMPPAVESVPAPVTPPTAHVTHATKLRLTGEPNAIAAQVNLMRNAGFTIVSEHTRKTRDVNSTEIIYDATLIT